MLRPCVSTSFVGIAPHYRSSSPSFLTVPPFFSSRPAHLGCALVLQRGVVSTTVPTPPPCFVSATCGPALALGSSCSLSFTDHSTIGIIGNRLNAAPQFRDQYWKVFHPAIKSNDLSGIIGVVQAVKAHFETGYVQTQPPLLPEGTSICNPPVPFQGLLLFATQILFLWS